MKKDNGFMSVGLTVGKDKHGNQDPLAPGKGKASRSPNAPSDTPGTDYEKEYQALCLDILNIIGAKDGTDANQKLVLIKRLIQG